MKRRRRSVFLLCAVSLLIVSMTLSIYLAYGNWRQWERNTQLIAAIRRSDPAEVRQALAQGADPYARAGQQAPASLWALLWRTWRRENNDTQQDALKIEEDKIIDYEKNWVCTGPRSEEWIKTHPEPPTEFHRMCTIYQLLTQARSQSARFR